MSRVLITGALGTLGRPLVQELDARGHQVWGIDLQHSPYDNILRADVADYRQVEEIFKQINPEYVYHLAAEFGRLNGEQWYEQLWRTNAIGTRNILELCAQRHQLLGNRPSLIFASSSEIYGEISGHTPITEEDDMEGYPLNDYAISKWANEMQIKAHMKRYGTSAMILRFFNAYGPGEYYHPYRSVCALFCHAALHDEPVTVFDGYHRVFMYIDDFIPTLANACEKFTAGEVINIGGSEYREVIDVANIAFDYLNKEPKIILQPVDKHNVHNKRPDIQKAIKLLGHRPGVTLELGIPATLEWMKAEEFGEDGVTIKFNQEIEVP